MDVHDAAGATLRVTVGGKEYTLTRLSIGELFGHFQGRVKEEALADAKRIVEMLPESERRPFLLDAWRSLPEGQDLMRRVIAMMQSPAEMPDILWLSVRKHDPGFTQEDARAAVTPDALPEWERPLMWAAGLPQGDGDEGQESDAEDSEKKTAAN